MDAIVLVLAGVVAWSAFSLAIVLLCSVNHRVESGRMRIGSRVAERLLTFGDGIERGRRQHYAACDRMARRRPGYLEVLPNASRGRRAA